MPSTHVCMNGGGVIVVGMAFAVRTVNPTRFERNVIAVGDVRSKVPGEVEFRIEAQPRHQILRRERLPLTLLLAVLFGLGLWPGPFVRSLEQVCISLMGAARDLPSHPPHGVHQ
jgi:hypothetical protein